MIHRTVSALLASLPAMLCTIPPFFYFEESEYYTRPWQIAAAVFLAASFLLGLRILVRQPTQEFESLSAMRKRLFAYPLVAWILAVAVLFGLSFTPLVLGQTIV